jgi:hypothetical protein
MSSKHTQLLMRSYFCRLQINTAATRSLYFSLYWMMVTSQVCKILVWRWIINTLQILYGIMFHVLKITNMVTLETVSGKFNIEYVLMEITHRSDSLNDVITYLQVLFYCHHIENRIWRNKGITHFSQNYYHFHSILVSVFCYSVIMTGQ